MIPPSVQTHGSKDVGSLRRRRPARSLDPAAFFVSGWPPRRTR